MPPKMTTKKKKPSKILVLLESTKDFNIPNPPTVLEGIYAFKHDSRLSSFIGNKIRKLAEQYGREDLHVNIQPKQYLTVVNIKSAKKLISFNYQQVDLDTNKEDTE